jgi:hypothetical protein
VGNRECAWRPLQAVRVLDSFGPLLATQFWNRTRQNGGSDFGYRCAKYSWDIWYSWVPELPWGLNHLRPDTHEKILTLTSRILADLSDALGRDPFSYEESVKLLRAYGTKTVFELLLEFSKRVVPSISRGRNAYRRTDSRSTCGLRNARNGRSRIAQATGAAV